MKRETLAERIGREAARDYWPPELLVLVLTVVEAAGYDLRSLDPTCP